MAHTAYQHRPMSAILAPAADTEKQAPTDKPAADPVIEQKDLDPKYKGKTVDDVIDMHQNSERRLGQLQNEVGTLRGLVSDLSTIQRPVSEPLTPEQEPVAMSGDELLADPVSAIRKVVKQDFDAAEAKQDLAAADTLTNTEATALLRDYGDIDAIVSTEEFQTFATRTPGRQRDLQVAGAGEGIDQVRAARRLLEDFNDFKTQATPAVDTDSPIAKARAAATESGNVSAPISSKESLYESDVIALINSDSAKYRSPSFQAELMSAIKEGRFVKNA